MRCSRCLYENPDHADSCEKRGAALVAARIPPSAPTMTLQVAPGDLERGSFFA